MNKTNYKKEPVNKEKNQSSFDWLLFLFIAIVIVLLVFITAK